MYLLAMCENLANGNSYARFKNAELTAIRVNYTHCWKSVVYVSTRHYCDTRRTSIKYVSWKNVVLRQKSFGLLYCAWSHNKWSNEASSIDCPLLT